MPIYMKIDGVKGNVPGHDHKEYSGTANGGVWKTSNFLTRDTAARAALGQTKVKVFICPSDPGVVQISRISLTPSGGGVDGRDPAAKMQLDQLMNAARSHGPSGKLYIATDAGVYQNSSRFDGQGRLLMGTDSGVWRSGGANRARATNNLKQLGLACHGIPTVEIIVTDAAGGVLDTHRLRNATVSSHSGGILVALSDGSVK